MKTLNQTVNDMNCTEAEKNAIRKRLNANDSHARLAMVAQRNKQAGNKGGLMYEQWLQENKLK